VKKVLIAPDKFKGSLSASEVCDSIALGISKYDDRIDIIKLPLADGGEGSLEIINKILITKKYHISIQNPLGEYVRSYYLISEKKAFIELALASGLGLIEKEYRNPMYTTTIGVGEMILDAISNGVTEVFLFLGGSSTNDCGMGIASVLGYNFFDENKIELYPSGSNLIKIKSISRKNEKLPLDSIKFTVLYDVKNILYGKNGAAHIYASQKGASKKEVEMLDEGLKHFSEIMKCSFNADMSSIEGGGSAGGVSAGMKGIFGAQLKSGVDFIMDLIKFEDLLMSVDLIITGEGKLDNQSFDGKVVGKVLELSRMNKKKCIVFVGQNDLNEAQELNIENVFIDEILNYTNSITIAKSNASDILFQMTSKYLIT